MPRIAIAAAITLLSAVPAIPARAVEVESRVPGFSIAATDTLPAPRNRQVFDDGDFCHFIQAEPKGAEARQAAALGWYVTSEAALAGYTAVGIFSRGASATSGTCLVEDGNVVLYRDGQVVAIVYAPPHDDSEAGSIGGVVATYSPDRLRISDFTPAGFGNADLLLAPDTVAVVPVAASETVCGIPVPNLRGKSVAQVRQALAPQRWQPDVDPATADPRDSDSRIRGNPEIEGCSGTGYGFCLVRYRHPNGARLHITTAGDEPAVANYGVTCPESAR